MSRKMLCRILCCIAILCLTATSVFAAGAFPGSEETGSIYFNFNYEDVAVGGGSIDLRQVAVWDNGAKALVWAEGYADCGLDLEQLNDSSAAACLFVYAEGKGLPARSVQVGADGTALADELTLGVYLVSQTEPFAGYQAISPALICVPLAVGEEWILNVEAAPKLAPPTPVTTQPTEPTPPPDLPQTGQVNWPIPVLVLLGSAMVILGVCLRREKRHAKDI